MARSAKENHPTAPVTYWAILDYLNTHKTATRDELFNHGHLPCSLATHVGVVLRNMRRQGLVVADSSQSRTLAPHNITQLGRAVIEKFNAECTPVNHHEWISDSFNLGTDLATPARMIQISHPESIPPFRISETDGLIARFIPPAPRKSRTTARQAVAA